MLCWPPVVEAPHAEAGGVQQTVAVPGGGEGPQPLAGPSLRPPGQYSTVQMYSTVQLWSGGLYLDIADNLVMCAPTS